MMWRDLLKNSSYTLADALDLVDDDGTDVLAVVAKLAFRFDDRGKLRLAARPLRKSDVEDETFGLRYPSDFTLPFPGTDCIVVGTVRPGPIPRPSKVVSMAIGPVRKSVRVHGPRVYMTTPGGVRPGPSGNVVATPLAYRHAFGGREEGSTEHQPENPAGRGFALRPERLVGEEAHRLEPAEPSNLHPSAGCFAAIDVNWAPRHRFQGTYDAQWRRRRAPAAPTDRDPLYHSVARPEQRSSTHLTLPFTIELAGFAGDDELRLELPRYAIRVISELHGASSPVSHEAPLSRVMVDVDERVVELGFVAHVPLPMKWEKLRAVQVLAVGSLPDELKAIEVRP